MAVTDAMVDWMRSEAEAVLRVCVAPYGSTVALPAMLALPPGAVIGLVDRAREWEAAARAALLEAADLQTSLVECQARLVRTEAELGRALERAELFEDALTEVAIDAWTSRYDREGW